MTESLEHLKDWIGRGASVTARVDARAVGALEATLDREAAPKEGDLLPPGYHWILFNSFVRQSEVGPDGHPARGGFMPPVPLPRRMFAGGRLSFHAPLRLGEMAERVTDIRALEVKQGRSGPLVFVTVRHRVSGPAGLAIDEENDIVYRDLGGAPARPEPAPGDGAWRREIRPDPVFLFRYSALTYNGHRIHYDQPYVTKEEGYPGLIVHGPLIATLLLDLVRRERPDQRLAQFSFRAMSPLFDTAPFTVNGAPEPGGARIWATNPEGGLAMRAECRFA